MNKTVLALAALLLAVDANAQIQTDHLACYKVKDPQAKASYVAQLDGLTVAAGCVIKVPAKLACVPTAKTITAAPFPPGGGGSGTPNSFFCYKVKCPKAALPAIAGTDQFGTRTVSPTGTALLCAPTSPPPTTTTTTTTTTTLPPPCVDNADCGGLVCDSCVYADCATGGSRNCTPHVCSSGTCSTGASSPDPCTRGTQDGLACTGGICGSGACCTGCFQSGTCQPGTTRTACGDSGDPCVVCPPISLGGFCDTSTPDRFCDSTQ